MKIIVIGAGMYVTGKNNSGVGTILSSLSQLSKEVEIEKITVQGESGAGAVKVTMKGNHKITNIEIDSSALNNDKKMLEDLIMAACNDAINKVEKEIKNKMGDLMNLPSGFKLPF